MPHFHLRALALATLSLLLPPSRVGAQTTQEEWNQIRLAELMKSGTRFGVALASLGDLDGDGEEEVAIGAPHAWNQVGRPGSIVVVSIPSWKLVRRIDGPRHGSTFGEELLAVRLEPQAKSPLLAVSGSRREWFYGLGDLAVPRSAALVDPATGETVRQLPGVFHVLGTQNDADGDGLRELVVESLRAEGWRTETLSGASGDPIAARTFAFHAKLLDLDFDGDGALDFLREPRPGRSEVEVVSGDDGKTLATLPTPGVRPVGPWRLEVATLDLDGDRSSDVALHWPLGANGASEAVLFHGEALKVHRSLTWASRKGEVPRRFDFDDEVLAAGPDANGDGIDEVLVLHDFGGVSCYSGSDGAKVWGARLMTSWGVATIEVVRDVDGDGVPDLLCGCPDQPNHYGTIERIPKVTLLSGKTGKELGASTELTFPELSFRSREDLQAEVAKNGIHAVEQLGVSSTDLKVRETSDPKATLFGLSVAVLGDIDGDGEDEVAIGAPLAWSERGRTGAVLIVGVESLRLRRILWGPEDDGWFGQRVHALKLDPNAKSAWLGIDRFGVYDPATGECKLPLSGVAIQGLQNDLDGDGVCEIVAGKTHSGRTGKVLETFSNEGSRLLEVDVDGDGARDWMVPANEGDTELVIRSGRDGSELRRLPLPAAYEDYPTAFQMITADVDADGRRDLVVTLIDLETEKTRLLVYAGASLEKLREIPVQTRPKEHGTRNPDNARRELHSPGDLNEDGFDDVLAAATDFSDQSLTCYSGSDGTKLWRAERTVDTSPSTMDVTRDLNGDGVRDILVGLVMHLHGFGPPQFGEDGSVRILSGKSGEVLGSIEERVFPQISLERYLQTRKR